MNKLKGKLKSNERAHVKLKNDNQVIKVGIQSSGPAGKSAYDSWLELGNTGTEEEFIKSLEATKDYNLIENKPSIEWVDLIGNKSFQDLGILEIKENEIKNMF